MSKKGQIEPWILALIITVVAFVLVLGIYAVSNGKLDDFADFFNNIWGGG